jgi:AbrB family looped-hinge helix DNA binding protein
METSTLTRKGQTTIPKAIREQLKLKPGDRIGFVVDADGRVRLVPRNLTLDDLKRILPKPKRKVSDEELNAAIRDSWGARWRRFERQQAKRRRRAS